MKRRLDQELVARGLCESREQAQRLILAGEVRVNGHLCDKASTPCAAQAEIELLDKPKYVSRGGLKLEAALAAFGIAPAGWHCLDIGASTGGFTDCLLQHGAAHVTAVDVGRGQLHWKLREDSRVAVHEGVNARHMAGLSLSHRYHLAVADVSFISLRLVMPPLLPLLAPGAEIIALIKPQFEAGPEKVGKGGIVRDAGVREAVIEGLVSWSRTALVPFLSRRVHPSPITGRDGNIEYLWHLASG
jgi:23S rRNA (cytidine1920-2'-O)/16S rRNA (cytidine1409-2'-O)-methyltransferase